MFPVTQQDIKTIPPLSQILLPIFFLPTMEPADHGRSHDAVVENKDLVGEIILRTGCSKTRIRCSCVSSTWLAATKIQCFTRQFLERNTPASLGFIVECQVPPCISHRVMKLLYPTASTGEESSVALRRHVEAQALATDNVLGSRGGIILTQGAEMGSIPSLYFISCPCEEPRVYTSVGYIIPPIHCKESKNTYGQFGVLPDAGDSGMSFFVKDSCNGVTCSYAGATF
jgi:hypothetical protein